MKLTMALLALVLATAPALAQDGPAVGTAELFISPASVVDPDLIPGSTFEVQLKGTVDVTHELYIIDVVILYDANCLSVASYEYGDFFVSPTDLGVTYCTDGYLYIAAVDFGRDLAAPIPPMDETHGIVTITFEVLATGSSPIIITAADAYTTPFYGYIEDDLTTTWEFPVTGIQSGNFSNVSAPPAPPPAAPAEGGGGGGCHAGGGIGLCFPLAAALLGCGLRRFRS